MDKDKPLLPDDSYIFVPEEIIRSINRALNSIEQARQGFIEAREMKKREKVRKSGKNRNLHKAKKILLCIYCKNVLYLPRIFCKDKKWLFLASVNDKTRK